MTRRTQPQKLTEIDLMLIRAGGRTEAEFEAMIRSGFGFHSLLRACNFARTILHRLIARHRLGNEQTSAHKINGLAAKSGAAVDGNQIG